MKKLAMALACLVSVAFFASCTQETPNPTISVATQEGFIQNNDVVDVPSVKKFGFNVAAELNGKDLTKLYVTVSDGDTTITWADLDLTALAATRSYAYVDSLELRRDIIGHVNINAVVTDAAGKTATASIGFDVNEPAQPLVSRTFEWYRWGSDIQGLDQFGLKWKGNYPKADYAKLVPLEGVKLFIFEAKDWDEVTTDVEKTAFFNQAIETMTAAEEYWEVNVTQMNMTYDDVIGTIMPDGTCHLIHVTNSHSEYVAPNGTKITITGESK